MSTDREIKKRSIYLGIFLVGAMVLVVNLTRSAIDLIAIKDRVETAEKSLEKQVIENQNLSELNEWTKSEGYVEQEIRDKLHMSREKDVVVAMPQSTIWSEVEMMSGTEYKVETRNWKRWVEVFIKPNK